MEPRIESTTTTKRFYLGVRRTVKPAGIGALCGEILPRTRQWLSEQGVEPDGPPMVVYHSHDDQTGEFDLTPGFFVREAVAVTGDFMLGETAGGDALKALHLGPYEKLGETWSAVFARAAAMNRKVTKSSWELYLNTPDQVGPEELRTEIYVPLDPP